MLPGWNNNFITLVSVSDNSTLFCLTDQPYFLEESFWWSPRLLVVFTISLLAVIFLRYLMLSAAYHWWTRLKRASNDAIPAEQFLKEVKWSFVSSAIFTLLSMLMIWVYQLGYTKVYTEIDSRGWIYFFVSLGLYLILYETYYYWLHRWMHRPAIFRVIHKIHHESINTSAFTSFSFHPLEALLQFTLLPVLIMVFPINLYALGIFLVFMTVSAIINHAGIEVYPPWFLKHRMARWLIGSTHHDLHHKEFKTNYGLYFTFWDKWMNTESKMYPERFTQNTLNRSRSQHHPSTDALHK